MRRALLKITRRAALFMFAYLIGYHLGLQDAAMGARPRYPRD